jgi:cytolysin (calcineurin-like family phosphatase)
MQAMTSRPWLRQTLLALAASVLLAACSSDPFASKEEPSEDFFFFAASDPQINVPRWGVAGLDSMVTTIEQISGRTWPFEGRVGEPRGLLIPGDLIDDTENRDNWTAYKKYFDPEGEAVLDVPVFAGIGNHDLTDAPDQTFSYVERDYIQRNTRRRAALNLGPEGYHYSWNWENVHFVNLNVFPGNEARPVYDNPAPWNDPKDALDFLKNDLENQVGNTGRPVILMWHYGLRGWGLDKWWTQKDLDRLKSTLAGYNVALILHGHEHRYERYEWAGYDVVMAPAFYTQPEERAEVRAKGVLVFRVSKDALQMAHHGSRRWQERWSKPLRDRTAPE